MHIQHLDTPHETSVLDFQESLVIQSVKNRFSELTKEKEGRDQQGKEITNDCQGKALKEGCHEREQAQMDVSSTEKTNTKEDLTRVMTKSKSRT